MSGKHGPMDRPCTNTGDNLSSHFSIQRLVMNFNRLVSCQMQYASYHLFISKCWHHYFIIKCGAIRIQAKLIRMNFPFFSFSFIVTVTFGFQIM